MRPWSLSGSPPSKVAQVLFRLRIVPSLSMAKTPSSMLDSIASRSFCWRSTVWIRSSNCSAMRFMASATAPTSSEPAIRSRWSSRPAANRSAPALISSSGRLMRREITRLMTAYDRACRSGPPRRPGRERCPACRVSAVTGSEVRTTAAGAPPRIERNRHVDAALPARWC